jgi:hypothetical protein
MKNQYEKAKEVKIEQLTSTALNKNGLPYKFKVTLVFTGTSFIANFAELSEVYNFIKDNDTYRHPTWEEVTSNGKYSAE